MVEQDWPPLIKERDAWVEHNFPQQESRKRDTVLGCIEEVGELTHAYLKMQQGIRGTREEHLEQMQDSIGDLTVYLLGVMSYTGFHPEDYAINHMSDLTVDGIIQRLAFIVGNIAITSFEDLDPGWITELVIHMHLLCYRYGWDYDEIVRDTWNGVKERDWQKFPTNGINA